MCNIGDIACGGGGERMFNAPRRDTAKVARLYMDVDDRHERCDDNLYACLVRQV